MVPIRKGNKDGKFQIIEGLEGFYGSYKEGKLLIVEKAVIPIF